MSTLLAILLIAVVIIAIIIGLIYLVVRAIPYVIGFIVFAAIGLTVGGVSLILLMCFGLDFSSSLVLGLIISAVITIALSVRAFSGGYTSGEYVLNKKTGVIHSRWNSDGISERNMKVISSSEADELVKRGGKYHYKHDS